MEDSNHQNPFAWGRDTEAKAEPGARQAAADPEGRHATITPSPPTTIALVHIFFLHVLSPSIHDEVVA